MVDESLYLEICHFGFPVTSGNRAIVPTNVARSRSLVAIDRPRQAMVDGTFEWCDILAQSHVLGEAPYQMCLMCTLSFSKLN